jgi:IS30 family transposase
VSHTDIRGPTADQQQYDAAAPARRLHPQLVRDALAKIKTLPEALRASLIWDQGSEMGKWKQVAVDADIDIFFCDPHAPWQRATNENSNGLLRQYFPKSNDLSVHSNESSRQDIQCGRRVTQLHLLPAMAR